MNFFEFNAPSIKAAVNINKISYLELMDSCIDNWQLYFIVDQKDFSVVYDSNKEDCIKDYNSLITKLKELNGN